MPNLDVFRKSIDKALELSPENITVHTLSVKRGSSLNENGGDIQGSKGVPDEILKEASQSGVSKINVDTDVRLALTAGIRKIFKEEPELYDMRKYMGSGREVVKETVKRKIINVFGSNNKIN